MTSIRATSVHVPTSASMTAQVAAHPSKLAGASSPQPAGENKGAKAVKQTEQVSRSEQMKVLDAQIAAATKKITNQNALDISYNKKEALLSVKVQERQSGDLVRELKFKDYKAMAYSNHGYKGGSVDITA